MSVQTTGAQVAGIYQFTGLASKIGIGVIIGLIFSQFICGTKVDKVTTKSDTVVVQLPTVHDTTHGIQFVYLKAGNIKGIPKDSSPCPVFDVWQLPIDGDTLSLIGIDAKTQTIGVAFFSYRDSFLHVSSHDTTVIHISDSTVIHEVAKVAGLGYSLDGYFSTERFGAVLDGYYDKYHAFIGSRIRYQDPGSVWKKFGVEAGIGIQLLSSP